MANPDLKAIGTVWEALQRLASMSGSSMDAVGGFLQEIINDPLRRRQVFLAMSGELVVSGMSREEWVEREMGCLGRLADLPSLSFKPDADCVARAWHEGCGAHDHWMQKTWRMEPLLNACKDAGIKMANMSIPSAGKNMPTDEGVIRYDFEKIMKPTTPNRFSVAPPFNLTNDQQVEWAKNEGGDGLTSVEETLFLILVAWVMNGRMPFMGGWIRCRNGCGSGQSLGVDWLAVGGLLVGSDDLSFAGWGCGAVPRVFQPVGI